MNYPSIIPEAYSTHPDLASAYRAGWQCGHGVACHCVPSLGDRISPEVDYWGLGSFVDESNIRQYHELLTLHNAQGTRPKAEEVFDVEEGEAGEDELWEAFAQGETDSAFEDLRGYTNSDYGIRNDPPSPFVDDDWDGNDDHIDALKDALRDALDTVHALRKAYGPLHDTLSDLVEGGAAHARAAMTQDMVDLLADHLAACVKADQEAKDVLDSIPEGE